MAGTDINQVLADNLKHYMDKHGLKQSALAQKSGVAQTTISLYLRPGSRELCAPALLFSSLSLNNCPSLCRVLRSQVYRDLS